VSRPGRCLLAAAALLLAGPPALAAAREPTPFVYVVVVDALDGDKVEAGGMPFVSSLLEGQGAEATYYPGSRSIMPSVTNTNHQAMMSGAFARGSGVAANAYAIYAPLPDEDSCATTGPFDLTTSPTPTTGESFTCPRAEFTFEAIKRQSDRRGRPTTAVVFGKPQPGRIFAGRNVSPDRTDADHVWTPCTSSPEDDGYCDPSADTNPITNYAINDEIVMDEVIRTVEEGVMARGKLRRPRLTFVNLPQVDSAGHAFGTGGPYDAAILQADGEIERLVETLRDQDVWRRSVLVLVSDHSMENVPGKVDIEEAFAAEGIAPEDFLAVDAENGGAMLVYLGDRTASDRHELLKLMRETALATPGVGTATYRRPNPEDEGRRHTTARRKPGWHVGGRRGGDLFLTTAPGNVFIDPDRPTNLVPGHHGSPATRDNFLAVVGANGGPVRQRTILGRSRSRLPLNIDVAPTVMRLLGLDPPADNRGRELWRAFEPAALER
jgi:hypothetical protein